MIDICTFAAGLSRQLYGLTISSERPHHRMMETWHPLGVVGIISAFNFPVAVWSWNAALALVCGNAVVWKPSEKTPLTALAAQSLFERADGIRARARRNSVDGVDRRARNRRGADRSSSGSAPFSNGLDGDGPRGGSAGGRTFRTGAAGARRQQRGHCLSLGGSRIDFTRHRFLGHGYRRAALYIVAQADRPRRHLRTC